ncbi:MAG: hypothetical protein ACO2Z9_00125 [Crocinitomicaceae bacterium]
MRTLLLSFLITLAVTPVYSQSSEKKALKIFIKNFFEALHKKDTTYLGAQFREGAVLSTQFVSEGTPTLFSSDVSAFLENIYAFKDQEMEETVKHMKIHIDGDLAHLWMKYKFYFNGELQHIGSNSFSMVKENGRWVIRDLIDTYYPVENKKGGQ